MGTAMMMSAAKMARSVAQDSRKGKQVARGTAIAVVIMVCLMLLLQKGVFADENEGSGATGSTSSDSGSSNGENSDIEMRLNDPDPATILKDLNPSNPNPKMEAALKERMTGGQGGRGNPEFRKKFAEKITTEDSQNPEHIKLFLKYGGSPDLYESPAEKQILKFASVNDHMTKEQMNEFVSSNNFNSMSTAEPVASDGSPETSPPAQERKEKFSDEEMDKVARAYAKVNGVEITANPQGSRQQNDQKPVLMVTGGFIHEQGVPRGFNPQNDRGALVEVDGHLGFSPIVENGMLVLRTNTLMIEEGYHEGAIKANQVVLIPQSDRGVQMRIGSAASPISGSEVVHAPRMLVSDGNQFRPAPNIAFGKLSWSQSSEDSNFRAFADVRLDINGALADGVEQSGQNVMVTVNSQINPPRWKESFNVPTRIMVQNGAFTYKAADNNGNFVDQRITATGGKISVMYHGEFGIGDYLDGGEYLKDVQVTLNQGGHVQLGRLQAGNLDRFAGGVGISGVGFSQIAGSERSEFLGGSREHRPFFAETADQSAKFFIMASQENKLTGIRSGIARADMGILGDLNDIREGDSYFIMDKGAGSGARVKITDTSTGTSIESTRADYRFGFNFDYGKHEDNNVVVQFLDSAKQRENTEIAVMVEFQNDAGTQSRVAITNTGGVSSIATDLKGSERFKGIDVSVRDAQDNRIDYDLGKSTWGGAKLSVKKDGALFPTQELRRDQFSKIAQLGDSLYDPRAEREVIPPHEALKKEVIGQLEIENEAVELLHDRVDLQARLAQASADRQVGKISSEEYAKIDAQIRSAYDAIENLRPREDDILQQTARTHAAVDGIAQPLIKEIEELEKRVAQLQVDKGLVSSGSDTASAQAVEAANWLIDDLKKQIEEKKQELLKVEEQRPSRVSTSMNAALARNTLTFVPSGVANAWQESLQYIKEIYSKAHDPKLSQTERDIAAMSLNREIKEFERWGLSNMEISQEGIIRYTETGTSIRERTAKMFSPNEGDGIMGPPYLPSDQSVDDTRIIEIGTRIGPTTYTASAGTSSSFALGDGSHEAYGQLEQIKVLKEEYLPLAMYVDRAPVVPSKNPLGTSGLPGQLEALTSIRQIPQDARQIFYNTKNSNFYYIDSGTLKQADMARLAYGSQPVFLKINGQMRNTATLTEQERDELAAQLSALMRSKMK